MNAYSEKSEDLDLVEQPQIQTSRTRRILTHLAFVSVLLLALYYFVGIENYQIAIESTSKAIHKHCGHRLAKRKQFTDEIGFRVLIGIGVFAVLNFVVITVHHIVQKIARSTNSYKTIDHVVSPF